MVHILKYKPIAFIKTLEVHWIFKYVFILKKKQKYRVPQDESAVLTQNIPYVKLQPHDRIFLYSKNNGNGENGVRKMWSCCSLTCVIRTLRRSVLEPLDKPGHTEASVPGKVLGTVRPISLKVAQSSSLINVLMSFRCWLHANCTCQHHMN